ADIQPGRCAGGSDERTPFLGPGVVAGRHADRLRAYARFNRAGRVRRHLLDACRRERRPPRHTYGSLGGAAQLGARVPRKDDAMKKRAFILAAACASVVAIGAQSAGAAPGNVSCTDAFSGTAANVTVPAENFCDLSGATVTNDVLVGREAGIFAEGLTLGHDVRLPQAGAPRLRGPTDGNKLSGGAAGGTPPPPTTTG